MRLPARAAAIEPPRRPPVNISSPTPGSYARRRAKQRECTVLALFGLFAIVLAAVDATLRLFGVALMTTEWSPALLLVLGILFVSLDARPRRHDEF